MSVPQLTVEATSDPRVVLERAPELLAQPVLANLMVPIIHKYIARIQTLHDNDVDFPQGSRHCGRWFLIFTEPTPTTPRRLDFIVSVTSSRVGQYPLFIFSPHPRTSHTAAFLSPRFRRIVDAIVGDPEVSRRRVFAVFGQKELVSTFVSFWSNKTGIAPVQEPYYAAVLATATPSSLHPPPSTTRSTTYLSYLCRAARPEDIPEAAQHCKSFADDSVIYPMTLDAAHAEAEGYVREQCLYVCEVETSAGERKIASIVAATRNSYPSAFVTKVFTAPEFRGKGIAQRLVRWTCEHYFTDLGYQRVSLYVDQGNKPAAKTYMDVGFEGIQLLGDNATSEDAGDWVEVGFDVEKTDLGFW